MNQKTSVPCRCAVCVFIYICIMCAVVNVSNGSSYSCFNTVL